MYLQIAVIAVTEYRQESSSVNAKTTRSCQCSCHLRGVSFRNCVQKFGNIYCNLHRIRSELLATILHLSAYLVSRRWLLFSFPHELREPHQYPHSRIQQSFLFDFAFTAVMHAKSCVISNISQYIAPALYVLHFFLYVVQKYLNYYIITSAQCFVTSSDHIWWKQCTDELYENFLLEYKNFQYWSEMLSIDLYYKNAFFTFSKILINKIIFNTFFGKVKN